MLLPNVLKIEVPPTELTTIFTRLVQPKNASVPMVTIEAGTEKDDKLEQL